MKKVSIPDLIAGLEQQDWRALSRAITIVENHYEGAEELLDYAWKNSREDSFVIGITGAGGAGKSTLIDSVIRVYSRQGKRVGVLAVDPSSSYTGGAVLGDRIRMGSYSADSGVFIRSFGSRGSLGGISQGAKDVLYLYKAFGFDVIILESLGVGQAETDITSFVDVTAVVLAPGNGDYIQLAKAGTQEIADIFVVNKADTAEAETLYAQLIAAFAFLPEEKRPAMIRTIARDQKGIEELVELLYTEREKRLPERSQKKRVRILNEITSSAYQIFVPELYAAAEVIVSDVLAGKKLPFEAAKELGYQIYLKE